MAGKNGTNQHTAGCSQHMQLEVLKDYLHVAQSHFLPTLLKGMAALMLGRRLREESNSTSAIVIPLSNIAEEPVLGSAPVLWFFGGLGVRLCGKTGECKIVNSRHFRIGGDESSESFKIKNSRTALPWQSCTILCSSSLETSWRSSHGRQ
jgi:hypothetical protein